MKHTSIMTIALCGLLFAQHANAEAITVDPSGEGDYTTIQSAVNAAASGDTITMVHGVYTEDIEIPADKSLTVSGDVSETDAVIIRGKVTVRSRADLELQYVKMNAKGNKKGIHVHADASLNFKYSTLHHGRHGIIAEQDAVIEVYNAAIRDTKRHGILLRKDTRFYGDGISVRRNGRAGIRANRVAYFYLTESTVKKNATGIYFYKSDTDNSVTKTAFHNNQIAIRLNESNSYLNENTFEENSANTVAE